ncbi:hypothetical protein [Lysobacter sp. FW306-1B-D06B]|uniref:hypothetical protein n=1 Tax=Lysobacter sp. FW306-1B-D06B TaxID=3140250 RepID=UPI00314079AA
MNAITWLHIAAGLTALAAGTVAVAARKGGTTHMAVGRGFCVAMLVLGITAAVLSPRKTPPESPVGGLMVCYFVVTAWMAAHRRGAPGWPERIACAGGLLLGLAILAGAVAAARAHVPNPAPPGPVGLFVLGSLCLCAGLFDLRFVLRGALSPTQRITRHLGRMCFALFIATGSFFLGQQDVMPQAVRGSPVLIVLAVAPFGVLLFWLVRVRRSRRLPAMRATSG